MTFSTPFSTRVSKEHFSPGMKDSHPSRPNLLEVLNLFAMNYPNSSAHISLSKFKILLSLGTVSYCKPSNLFLIQLHFYLSAICIYSTPILPQ